MTSINGFLRKGNAAECSEFPILTRDAKSSIFSVELQKQAF